MPARFHSRSLARLLLLVYVWMAGASAACHTCLAFHRHASVVQSAPSGPSPGLEKGLVPHAGTPCVACSYARTACSTPAVPVPTLTLPRGSAAVRLPQFLFFPRLVTTPGGSRAPPAA
jgi:hypothetical protein